MASNADFVQYITDQCGGAGEIVAKKMFGDYGIYCNGKIFGLICDDRLYVNLQKRVGLFLRASTFSLPMMVPRTISILPMSTTATISRPLSVQRA